MLKMPLLGMQHGQAIGISHGYGLRVAERSTRLNDRHNPRSAANLEHIG